MDFSQALGPTVLEAASFLFELLSFSGAPSSRGLATPRMETSSQHIQTESCGLARVSHPGQGSARPSLPS